MSIDEAHARYLLDHHLGRLATVAPNGTPQNKPVGYRYNPELGTIDISGFNMETSAKYRNVAVNPDVSFVVDDSIGEGATNMRFVELRGRAEQAIQAPPPEDTEGLSRGIIRIRPRRLISWGVGSKGAALHSEDLATDGGGTQPAERPAVGRSGPAAPAAQRAVAALVAELQEGFDERDAEISNRHFARDLMWGSPFGVTVSGYDELHAIHERLKRAGTGGSASRFEIVRVFGVGADVAIAHVRRVALDDDGDPVPARDDATGAFSEMAMYVLVRRAGDWWLAGGQNTPIRPKPAD